MSKTVTTEILPENLLEHRAVKAWSQLEPERTEPEAIAVLRLTRKKSAVYRMAGVGPTGAAVIAKRCRTTTAIVERLICEEVLSSLSLPALGCYGFVPGANGLALLVYDWEMAGWGFPATDLAQVDRCARADLDAYYSAARQDFPQLDFRDIQRLANYGNLLRVVDAIYWATLFMVRETYKSLLKPLQLIGKYETQLAASLHAVNWNATAGWKRATRARLTPPPAQTN